MAASPDQSPTDARPTDATPGVATPGEPRLVSWRAHPGLAGALRAALLLLPVAAAGAVAVVAARIVTPERAGLDRAPWLALVVAACLLVFLGARRVARLLLPLTTVLRVALVLPDRVPSRVAAVRRPPPPNMLQTRVEQASGEEAGDGVVLLQLLGALSRHDHATYRHCERVQRYATLVGRELGLPPEDAARLGWAALLHDVGKVTVPTQVLNKPGRPDQEEWATLSGHAETGAALAAPYVRWLGPWAAAIDEHHERWDGTGYPDRLAGERISLAARVVAAADAFDVITSTRAYKTPTPPDAALAELDRCAGTHFDPRVVEAFHRVGLRELAAVGGLRTRVAAVPARTRERTAVRASAGAPAA